MNSWYLVSLKALESLPQIKMVPGILEARVNFDEASNRDEAIAVAFSYVALPQCWELVDVVLQSKESRS